ncbi:MAG: phosphomannose isomerase type II C-terminal cupin domain [Alphaproteobacteria bacterium]
MENSTVAVRMESAVGGIPYRVDDQDMRPWGHYIVTAVGTCDEGEYCEKIIVVKPGKILSLQSHELRAEQWTVKSGTLTAIVDDMRITAEAGEVVLVPAGSIHCMANLSNEDCVVEERQTGTCREEDIQRYADAYNRATEGANPGLGGAISIYKSVLSDLRHAKQAV